MPTEKTGKLIAKERLTHNKIKNKVILVIATSIDELINLIKGIRKEYCNNEMPNNLLVICCCLFIIEITN